MNLATKLTSILGLAVLLSTGAMAQETRSFTDDLGRTVDIPSRPLRIVSLHDTLLTIPLIELGVYPAGSFGRTADDGSHYIRSSAVLTGVDFNNSEIKYIGEWAPDAEAIAALQPDLILTIPDIELPVDTLQAIAPTVMVDYNKHPGIGTYDVIADIVNAQDKLAVLQGRYEAQIAQIKRVIDTQNITVNVIQPGETAIYVSYTYGALGQVLRDAGFKFPPAVEALGAGGEGEFSAEQVQELDADFIFDNYYATATSGVPQDQIDSFEKLLPGYCEFLAACRNNQYILLPRDESYASSYYTLGLMTMTVLSHMSGVRVVTGEAGQ
jgi:iron complex transport system substrate-binding protein